MASRPAAAAGSRTASSRQGALRLFPVTAAGPALVQVFAAKAVCFGCAVRAACLSFALATGQAGIWGGTTQEERRAMRRPSGFPAREHRASLGSAATHHRSNPAGQ